MRRAYSLAEVCIAVLVLGAAITPIYSIFVNSSKAAVSSKLAYVAAQVARETMEELRQVPFDKLEELNTTQPQSVTGGLWAMTAKYRGDALAQNPAYPEDYRRILRSIKVEAVDGSSLPQSITGTALRPRLKKITLDVSWQESGGNNEKSRPGLQHYVSFIGCHAVDPEVPE